MLKILTLLVFSGITWAQCIVNNPGGSKINPNKPIDLDTPEAAFSPLSVVNHNLPRWLCFTAGYRTRLEGDSPDLLTRFRLGMLTGPSRWFKVYTELQDADAFFKTPPRTPPYQETWDLRRAYVDIGDVQDGHFGIRAGRQDLNFEDGRLLGTSYWRNASRGYDAVEAVTNWSWMNATAFAASQVVIGENGLSHHQPGRNLYGLDAKLNRAVPAASVEPFLFWRVAPDLDEKVLGARFAGTVRGAWDYDTEGAGEFGNRGRAWAWLGIGGYTFRNRRWKTRLFAEYDFASAAFDQLSPNVHDHLGLADQFAWQNLKTARAGARVWLRPNWIVAGAWGDYWLASAAGGYYNSAGAIVARDPKGLSGTHIGEEYDIQTSYRLDRNLEFGVGLGHLLPGGFLTRTGHPASYNYPYVLMSYNFF